VDEVIYRMIDARRRSAERHDDLLGMMLAAEPDADRRSLRDQVVTILLAGYETVANAMTWTWFLLAQNPDAERKLHQEVDAVLAGRLPTFDDVARLPYTEMVFAESLRIYPPAWAMGRQAVEPFTLGEYYLPPRTTVLISQFLLHRDPRFFPEPLAFRPERFAPEARAGMARFAYLPFGAGARRCIGESFAWMEGVLLLATFAQRWKLELVPGQRVDPEPLITLRPRYGLKVRCLPR
jgi:cytochrome P450